MKSSVLILLIAAAGCAGCNLFSSRPPVVRQQAHPHTPPTPPMTRPAQAPAPPDVSDAVHGEPEVRIRLAAGKAQVIVQAAAPLGISNAALPPGTWTFTLASATPASQQFHVFSKTFKPTERAAADAFANTWRSQGYPVQIVETGKLYRSEQGQFLDNRALWMSMARTASQAEAERIRRDLEAKDVWAWVRTERLAPGQGKITAAAPNHAPVLFDAPLVFTSAQPVRIAGTDAGESAAFSGAVQLAIGADSRLEVYESLPIEDYLRGVLPAEMPALWPKEALKAQAITARSDVLVAMGSKRVLEGYHFLATVADRAYHGTGSRHAATDAAVAETRGLVLMSNGAVVPGVFSSSCGGHTTNNDTAWYSPPDPNLRAVLDQALPALDPLTVGVAQWLALPSQAYCRNDERYHRWSRRLTTAEVTQHLNKTYAVGTVQSIELGDRGPGGRLNWIRVSGTSGTVTIKKELPIRNALGGLPSGLFIMRTEPGAFVFQGAGRGHGVGLCQYGAKGMAGTGSTFEQIVRHYYAAATFTKVY
ncbi:MAG: SpoIID/LytB domain-containing protein [Candidatus Hydrogenedentes bacterium]|nr:SpoIID/LytB domain-containing protein [Candidatus Hydrogenedentota bacterium]